MIIIRILGSSSPRSFSSCKKLESEPSPEPRNGRPCLDKNLTFANSFKKHCRCSSFSLECCLERLSPISRVVAGRVTILSKASLWHLLPSCEANLEVASFQLMNPVEI